MANRKNLLDLYIKMVKQVSNILCAAVFCQASVADFDQKWLEDVIRKEYSKEALRQIEKFDAVSLSPADPPGTVYGSNRTRAVVQMTLKSGEARRESFLVVALPSHPLREKQLTEAGLFQTDIKVYEQVLPKMNALLKDSNDVEKMWVEPLLLEKYKRLVLEDPEGLDYHLKIRRNGLDESHARVAVENLAKFHALSAVLKSKNQISVEPFNLALIQRNKERAEDWYGTLFKEFAKSIKVAWGPEWEKFVIAFENKAQTIKKDLLALHQRDESKFNVLVNGAYYINNMYFKNAPSGIAPVGIKIVNFQNAFWNSPAIDLQLFLNTSPESEILTDETKREAIVNHYAEYLQAYLKKYGYDRPITTEYIKSEIRRTELVGLAYAINFLSGIYTSPEDAAYSEEFIVEALKTTKVKIDSRGMVLPKFITVMKKLVERAHKLGFISAQ